MSLVITVICPHCFLYDCTLRNELRSLGSESSITQGAL